MLRLKIVSPEKVIYNGEVESVKFRDKTLAVLESGVLSPWVQNKAIQKCRESRRVSSEDKAMLLKLKV